MLLTSWDPSHTIAVIGVAATALVGIAGILTSHIRETRLQVTQLEADRAQGYRERALDTANRSTEIAYDMQALAEAPRPTAAEGVVTALRRAQPVFGKQIYAFQEAQRLATLGWSPAVRFSAQLLATELTRAGVAIRFPEMVIQVGIPEAAAISVGEQGFWSRHQDGLREGAEKLLSASRAFLAVIEP
jgi:hypothetical protein